MIHRVTLPVSRQSIRTWKAGDSVILTGRIYTARDAAHRRMLDLARTGGSMPFDPKGLPVFHCGPIARQTDDGWKIVSAGPTTSARMEPLESDFIETFDTPFVIGKGGMGNRTREALVRLGAAYVEATGGTGALGAAAVERVEDVYWLDDLGMPEAVWVLSVQQYGPLVVTMDSQGGDLRAGSRPLSQVDESP